MDVNKISTGNNEWYTPSKFVESARLVMGSISLDPASNDIAQLTVNADTYYTKETNGLDKEWQGNVWLNPPFSRELIPRFIGKAVADWNGGIIKSMVILVNSSTDTKWYHDLLCTSNAMLITNKRISFVNQDGNAIKGNSRG